VTDRLVEEDVSTAIRNYESMASRHGNYLLTARRLSDWYRDELTYRDPGWGMSRILDITGKLCPRKVLEPGAGAGKLAKMVYDVLDGDVDLFCVENNKDHYMQMLANFKEMRYEPKREVMATSILGSIHEMPQFRNNMFDLTYTHTVMMHIPFIPALRAAQELARVTGGHILHVENKNIISNVFPESNRRKKIDSLPLDYRKLYDMLGFETILHEEHGDDDKNTYVCYMGKKRK
jgi:SAM-dependent methyltransferase